MPAGRPTLMTESKVKELEDAFSWGCTDLEACCYANISKQTLYNYIEKHPEFLDRKETLKNQPVMKAKRIVHSALNDDDLPTANRVIDRKEGTKVKNELSGSVDSKWTVEFINAETKD